MRKISMAAALVALSAAVPAFAAQSMQARAASGAAQSYKQGVSNSQHESKSSKDGKVSASKADSSGQIETVGR
jgi:hypothetical protein